ncbi:MAG: hypothetical protein U0871_23170 [Gemmataceae bacterium]
MSTATDQLWQQLVALPRAEQEALGERLRDHLGWNFLLEPPPTQDEIDAANEAMWPEIERRLKEVEEHPERLLDGEQVMAALRARYPERSP